ncbi:MAG: YggS family pyridoxal phosphate-dependent enzyme [Ferruginibacter sp.]
MINKSAYHTLLEEISSQKITLVAVSKLQPVPAIRELYDAGQRDFGENYVQEMLDKQEQLPENIRWHFIGHLQSNKVKYIAPFVYMIHGIDSEKLLAEINKQAEKQNRIIKCLLQVHIAQEETKFGFSLQEAAALLQNIFETHTFYPNVKVCGLMGMASFSDDMTKVRGEFKSLARLYKDFHSRFPEFGCLSMGMSSDYKIAIEEGSTMIRVGSLVFGARN